MILASSSIISYLNPIHDVTAAASASASAIGDATWKAIASGMSAVIMTAIKGIISGLMRTIIAMIQHTTPQFAKTHYSPVQPALFNPVWHVMVIVGITFAVLIMFIGVISSILKGETGLLLKQLAFGLIAVLFMASPVPPLIAQAIFSVIDVFSRFILDAALAQGGHAGFFKSSGHSALVAKDAVAMFSAANPGISLGFIALVGIFTLLAAAAVWFELLAREAIAYLIMGLFPLALAGVFHKGSSRWLRRAIEGLLAVALGQIVIAILFAFAVSSLLLGGQNMSLTNFGLFAIFMFLASVGLPIAMRVAPMAFEFGEAALHSSSLAQSARGAVAAHTTAPAKAALTQRVGGALTSKISGKGGAGKGGGGSSAPKTPRNSMTEAFAFAGEVGSSINRNNGSTTPGSGTGNSGTTGTTTPGTSVKQGVTPGKTTPTQSPRTNPTRSNQAKHDTPQAPKVNPPHPRPQPRPGQPQQNFQPRRRPRPAGGDKP